MKAMGDIHRAVKGLVSGSTRTSSKSRGALVVNAPPPGTAQTPEQRARKIALMLEIRWGAELPAELRGEVERLVLTQIQEADICARSTTLARCWSELDCALNQGEACYDPDRMVDRAHAIKRRWVKNQKRWEAML